MNTPKRRFWVGMAIPGAGIAAGLAWAGAWPSEATGRGFLGLAAGVLILAGLITAGLLHRAWKRAMDLTARRYDGLLEACGDAAWVVRAGRIERVNREAVRLQGASGVADLEGLDPAFLFHAEGQERLRERFQAAGRGMAVRGAEEILVRQDGTARPVNVTLAPFQDAWGPGLHVLLRDLTRARRADLEVHRFNRALRVLSRWRPVLAVAGPALEADLLAPAVVALGEAYPETAVWIGLKENDPGRTLRPVARRCPPGAGLSERALTWAADGDGGAAGEAARTGRLVLYPDLWSESRREPLGEGYRTVLALPLAAGGAVLGVLALLAPEPEAFSGGEARILETLALGLGTVLAASRMDPGHGGPRSALKAREAPFQVAFDRMPVPMALTRPDGRLVCVNPALSRLLDYAPEALESMNLAEALHPDDQAPLRDALLRLSGGAQSAVHLALRCQRREGSVFWGTLDLIRMDEGQDGPGPMLACLQNITGRRHAEGGLALFRSAPAPGESSPDPAP